VQLQGQGVGTQLHSNSCASRQKKPAPQAVAATWSQRLSASAHSASWLTPMRPNATDSVNVLPIQATCKLPVGSGCSATVHLFMLTLISCSISHLPVSHQPSSNSHRVPRSAAATSRALMMPSLSRGLPILTVVSYLTSASGSTPRKRRIRLICSAGDSSSSW